MKISYTKVEIEKIKESARKTRTCYFRRGLKFTIKGTKFEIKDIYEIPAPKKNGKLYFLYRNGERYKEVPEEKLIQAIPHLIISGMIL